MGGVVGASKTEAEGIEKVSEFVSACVFVVVVVVR